MSKITHVITKQWLQINGGVKNTVKNINCILSTPKPRREAIVSGYKSKWSIYHHN